MKTQSTSFKTYMVLLLIFCFVSPAMATPIIISTVDLSRDAQGEGSKGQVFRPIDELGEDAIFVLTARSRIDRDDPFNPVAESCDTGPGTVYIDREGAGVKNNRGRGSKGISGGGGDQNEELIFTFDNDITPAEIVLVLAKIEYEIDPNVPGVVFTDDGPVLFVHSTAGDWYVVTAELISAVFSPEPGDDDKGSVYLGELNQIVPPGLIIDSFKIRATLKGFVANGIVILSEPVILDPGEYVPYDTTTGVGILYNNGTVPVDVRWTDTGRANMLDTLLINLNNPGDAHLIATDALSGTDGTLIIDTTSVNLTLTTGSAVQDIGTLWGESIEHLQGPVPGNNSSVPATGGDVTGTIDLNNSNSAISSIVAGANIDSLITAENILLVQSGGSFGDSISGTITADEKVGLVDAGNGAVNATVISHAATSASPLMSVIDGNVRYTIETDAGPSEAVFDITYYGTSHSAEVVMNILSGSGYDLELRTRYASNDNVNDAAFDLASLILDPGTVSKSLDIITVEGSTLIPINLMSGSSLTGLIVQENISGQITVDSIDLLSAATVGGAASTPELAESITQTSTGGNCPASTVNGTFRIPASPANIVTVFGADNDANTFNANDFVTFDFPAIADTEFYVTFVDGIITAITGNYDFWNYVPSEFSTIQAAIDASIDWGEVIVADGTYTGFGNKDLNLRGKEIKVYSENGPQNCIIDCQNDGRGFIFQSGETSSSIIEGFTIIQGELFGSSLGGGVVSNFSGPTIRNCSISNNTADCAGGIDIRDSSLVLDDVTITNNTTHDPCLIETSSGFTDSTVNIQGTLLILDEKVDIFGGQFTGPGSIYFNENSTLRIKRIPVCDPEIVTGITEGTLSATQLYRDNEWWIPSAQLSNMFVTVRDSVWSIGPYEPAQFVWYGSELDQDNSSGGQAEATFYAGGKILIYGDVYDETNTLLNTTNNLILSADVGEFTIKETSTNSNLLEFVEDVVILPTGGFLASNNLNTVLSGDQILSMVLGTALQMSGPLNDFQKNIASLSAIQLDITPSSLPTSETIITTDINGSGSIEIDAGAQLTIAEDAVVRLGDSNDCQPNLDTNGVITVYGSLVVTDQATLENSNVDVKLLGIETSEAVAYNNIILRDVTSNGLSTGYGGEFFVDENATINCNTIVSEGDRYLDLDPNPESDNHPTITNNYISVIIKEGKHGSHGTLLELRAKDYDCGEPNNPWCESGAYQVSPDSPGFTDDPSENWVLQDLILEENSKVNLTNRPGFVFQDPNFWETVYVKKLVLGRNAILNTALQTLYYQTLVDPCGVELVRDPCDPYAPLANGSKFQDVPLLGFSLVIIDMDDNTPHPNNEFDIRIRTRIRDDDDIQPALPDPPREGSIERITEDPEPDPLLKTEIPAGAGGVMDMRTKAIDKQSASSVAAKGAFARAGNESITVEFEYMFLGGPYEETELIVYLSDDPEVGKNLVRIAKLLIPPPGQPGSIGSGRFAKFSGTFSDSNLNFTRGTYVELELRGTDTRCWIDNFDPTIHCRTICMEITGDPAVNELDFLTVVGEYGQTADLDDDDRACMEGVFSSDGYVDAADIISWDWQLGFDNKSHLCLCGDTCRGHMPLSQSQSEAEFLLEQESLNQAAAAGYSFDQPKGQLLIAGKSNAESDSYKLSDYLYSFDSQSLCVDTNSCPVDRANIRLVKDPSGELYQLNIEEGMIRLSDGEIIIPPGSDSFTGADVEPRHQRNANIFVGLQGSEPDFSGRPVVDVAFDPQFASNNYVYVLPVVVDPIGDPNLVYTAAAKLELPPSGDPPYEVIQIYDDDPYAGDPHDIRNLDALRDIEIDSEDYLYVTNGYADNESDFLWVYDAGNGDLTNSLSLTNPSNELYLPAPIGVGMHASQTNNMLYLASSQGPSDANFVTIYGLSTNTLEIERTIQINRMAHITGITEDPSTGSLWVAGFRMEDVPETWEGHGNEQPFYHPYLAEVPSDSNSVEAISLSDINDPNNCDLALPLSIVWTVPSLPACAQADITGNGNVDMEDVKVLASQWLLPQLLPPGTRTADIAPLPDGDGYVNMKDLVAIARFWTDTNCTE